MLVSETIYLSAERSQAATGLVQCLQYKTLILKLTPNNHTHCNGQVYHRLSTIL